MFTTTPKNRVGTILAARMAGRSNGLMSLNMSPDQKAYLTEQLRYDHLDHTPPPNTLVVHQMQHARIIASVRQYARENPVHMLDVGCGWGDFSQKLDSCIQSYVGIEPSMTELRGFSRTANRYLVHGVGECADFLKDRSRNFILLNSVLDHSFEWQKMFAQCLRILAPGGLLIVSMENSEKLPVRVRRWLGRRIVHEGHLSFWSCDEVENLLKPHFRILERASFGYLFGFHQLTELVPLPLGFLRVLNRCANQIFGMFDPKGGHLLFFSALRTGDTGSKTDFSRPFCCPDCKADFAFGDAVCAQCRRPFRYAGEGILEGIEMTPALEHEIRS